MTDRYDQELLLGYIEDDLDPAQRAQFEQMMAQDEQLATLVRGLTADRDLLRSLPLAEAPAGLVDDALHHLERSMLLDGKAQEEDAPIPIQRGRELTTPATGRPWGRIVGITGMAAAVLLGVGITWYITTGDPLNRAAIDLASDTPPAPPESGEEASAFENAPFAELEATRDQPLDDASVGAGESTARLNQGIAGLSTARTRENQALDAAGRNLLDRATDAINSGPLASNQPSPLSPADNAGATPEPALPRPGENIALRSISSPAPPVADAPVVALANNNAIYDAPAPQLFVLTDSPDITRKQIFMWCLSNGVPVVEAEGLDFAANAQPLESYAAEGQAANAQPNQFALLIEADQLGALVESVNRVAPPLQSQQRAVITNDAQPMRQRAALREQRSIAPVVGPAQPEPDTYVQFKASNSLGSEEAIRQNYHNVVGFNNRVALEGNTPDTSQQTYAPAAKAEDTEEETDLTADEKPEQEAQPAEELAPARAESPVADQSPADLTADVSLAGDVEAGGHKPLEKAAKPTARRGNWLSPQLPLANTTPIWSDAPQTRIVPIILQIAAPADIEAFDLANNLTPPPATQPANDNTAENAPAPQAPPAEAEEQPAAETDKPE